MKGLWCGSGNYLEGISIIDPPSSILKLLSEPLEPAEEAAFFGGQDGEQVAAFIGPIHDASGEFDGLLGHVPDQRLLEQDLIAGHDDPVRAVEACFLIGRVVVIDRDGGEADLVGER